MTCRAATGFVFHSPDFSVVAPCGWAPCRRCGGLVDLETFTGESCPGAALARPPSQPTDPTCARCGVPLVVDPMHRAVVEWFGGRTETHE